ncbi:hypothetical protein [Ulvibacterium marinum]|nr:hypothetical protein [Ulvibacterium marinum]
MQNLTKIYFTVMLLVCFQSGFGQSSSTSKMFQAMAESESDLLIRINNNMNEKELQSRIAILHHLDKAITIDYSRDASGNITTLSSSGGKNKGSCESDDFGYLIISLQNNRWRNCMISDKE